MTGLWVLSVFMTALSVNFSLDGANVEEGRVFEETIEPSKMTVRVMINGQEADATIDTGATHAMVDDDFIAPDDLNTGRKQVIVVGVGGVRAYEAVDVKSLRLSGVDLGPISAALNTNDDFPGPKTVIPAMALEGRILNFNYPENRIESRDTKQRPSPDYFSCDIPYYEIQDLPFIDISVNGISAKALIDTGAAGTLVNPELADLAKLRVDPKLSKIVFGADMNEAKASVRTARRILIGEHRISRLKIVSAKSPLFEHLGLASEPVMVIGEDILKHFQVAFDREMRTVRFGRQLTSAERSIRFDSSFRARNSRSKDCI